MSDPDTSILSQLTAGVVHEVRNPLNAIWAVTEALFQEIEDRKDLVQYKNHIRCQVDRLIRLMQDLIDFGKPSDENAYEKIPLPELFRSTVDLWNHSGEKGNCLIRLDADENRLKERIVFGDISKLQHAFLNIFENSMKHGSSDCEIRIFVHNPENDMVLIDITDNGRGIDPDKINRVFDPFFTAGKNGTGLGLPIVKNIIEAHGGTVAVNNNDPPPGVTVSLQLPLITDRKEHVGNEKISDMEELIV